jgi:alpha-L-fucosidase
LKLAAAAVTAVIAQPTLSFAKAASVPSYLRGYAKPYADNPREAGLQWFRSAKFGLFIHYGVYSQLKRDAWEQFAQKIPVAEYAKLKEMINPEKFDVNFITDLALAANMRYVNITTRHHDGFCLFDTKQTDFNSVKSPARRDLVGELAEACQKKGLGLCLKAVQGG